MIRQSVRNQVPAADQDFSEACAAQKEKAKPHSCRLCFLPPRNSSEQEDLQRLRRSGHVPANVSIPPRRTAEDTAVSAPVQFNRIICTSEKIHTTAILPYCRKKILTCFGKLRLTFRKCCSLKFSNAAGMLSIFNEKKDTSSSFY